MCPFPSPYPRMGVKAMDHRNLKGDTKFLLDKVREAATRQGREELSDDEILQRALRHQLRTMGVPAREYQAAPVEARN